MSFTWMKKVTGRVKNAWHNWRFKQHWGFHPEDTWSFDATLIKFALPRLKWFRDVGGGIPGSFLVDNLNNEKLNWKIAELRWMRIMSDMVRGFELAMIDLWGEEPYKWRSLTYEEHAAMDRAATLLGRYLYCLWT